MTMTMREAAKALGLNRTKWEVRHMEKALSLHSWNNTPEDNLRLKACNVVLADWGGYQKIAETMRGEMRSAFG